MRSTKLIFFILAVTFLIPAPARAQSQLSGTVIDTSGAVIAGATVQAFSANGTAQRTTQSDRNGSFILSGLAAGSYRLVVSNPGFETKGILVTIGTAGAPASPRITLVVGAVSTTINVQGREDDLIGVAESGTQGTVGAKEIQDRPILRSGEILETVPGLIITQHAGGGKANQYFLRGFNLDHGTDIAIFLDDMPLNLPSHAHGEGYSDMNTVIPEFVERVNFEKGPYYANVGNFSSAANANVEFFKTLPENFFQVEGGTHTYGRTVFGASQKLGSGNLLYGGEEYYYDGPWVHPDAYDKINGILTYSQGDDTNGASITARAYHGKWNSSDQIPDAAQPLVGFFGTLNPSDGGRSQRYSLQGEWHHQGDNSESKVMASVFYYDLDLFSDFTYYLVDYGKEDQFNQQDRRWVGYLDAQHTIFSKWLGRKMSNTFGVQYRSDWINNGLYRTQNRVRTAKTDYSATAWAGSGTSFFPAAGTGLPNAGILPTCINAPNSNITLSVTLPTNLAFTNNGSTAAATTVSDTTCPTLPATTERDNFTDTLGSAYWENTIQWANKFRSVYALRGDEETFAVASLAYPTDRITLPDGTATTVNAANSGSAAKFLPSPKASLIFGPWANTEFYLQGGFSFHSNDGRGSTQLVEPVSPDYPYPGQIMPKISPLVEQKGGEIGVRTAAVPHLQSTFELWYLHSNSELTQDGDTGGTIASEQSSNRYGIEWANYYTPAEHLTFAFDIADSRAQFTQLDPFDATWWVVNVPLTATATTRTTMPFSTTYYNGTSCPATPPSTPIPGCVYVNWQQQGPGGKLVPEAVKVVVSAGATLHDYKGLSSSLRLRYFGPRYLTSDGRYQSSQTVLLNGEVGYQFFKKWHVTAELLNMLNRKDADIDYAYVYQITPNATATPPAFGRVTHPTEPFLVRFALGRSFGGTE
ncbi:MAG: TonB-dependent receptor [Terracidiphilus sp.]